MIKPYIAGLLRRLGLLAWMENARFFLYRIGYRNTNKKFLSEHPGIEMPPDFFLYETYLLNYEYYFKDGCETAREVVDLVKKHLNISQPGSRCLDWGCGPARITRHWPDLLPEAELHAADYNEKYIHWCRSKIKGIRFEQVNVAPPTLYPAAFFDFVMGLSVFTHLSALNHYTWMDELHRFIKPGGILFITTQGNAYQCKLSAGEKIRFREAKLVVRDRVKEGNRLFSAFHPRPFIESLVKDKFEIVECIPGRENQKLPEQDTWILRRLVGKDRVVE